MQNNLAVAYREAGRYEDAVKVAAELLPRARQNLGDEHSFTLDLSETLGNAYVGLGRFEEAIRHLPGISGRANQSCLDPRTVTG